MRHSLALTKWVSTLAAGSLLLCSSAMASPKPAELMPKANTNIYVDLQKVGDHMVAVGDRGNILLLDGQGNNWKQSPVPADKMFTAVYFVDENNGWAVGYDGNIVHSTDGGKTWQLQRDGLAAQAQINEDALRAAQAVVHELEAAEMVDEAALDDAKMTLEDAQAKMRDKVVAPPLLDVWFKDKNNGWAVGAFGTYLTTIDGGKTWLNKGAEVAALIDGYHIHSVTGTQDGSLILAGEAGILDVSHDGGQTWQKADVDNENSLFAVQSNADGSLIIATGLRGTTLRSTDKGTTWQDISPNTNNYSLANVFLNGQEVLLVGSGGMVAKSTNAGDSFKIYVFPDRTSLGQAVDLGNGQLVLVGEGGIRHFDLNAVDKE